ncbi:MAG: ATP-binding protein [Prevotellaceae bacterium]|nr:ATP-binding protein [Prevotellaceae bacterium]
MEAIAEYIERIEIDQLWSGQRHVDWRLERHVNVLSGVNGVGKSTILSRVVRHLMAVSREEKADDGVVLTYNVPGARTVRFDVVRSFDRPVVNSELLGKITDIHLSSELDLQLYQLQRAYLDYQVNLSNRMLRLFTEGDAEAKEKAATIAEEKTHFFDVVDSLFCDTGKLILRERNEILFSQRGETISPYLLSSGEKQILIILLTVLTEARQPCVLLMDEPEISLHVEWQERLIGLIRDLNPEAQIILTTHSPAVIIDGWGDCVTDVEDIISDPK